MLFLVGLLLTPVMALAGTLTVAAIVVLGGGSLAMAMAPILLIAGMIEGSLHAAPVTMLALPATYAVLRRYAALKVWRLALAGGVAGIALILLVAVVLAIVVGRFETAFEDLVTITAVGGFSGVVAGACFAWAMRWLRPDPWRGAQARPGP
jgi:hypothetical protein